MQECNNFRGGVCVIFHSGCPAEPGKPVCGSYRNNCRDCPCRLACPADIAKWAGQQEPFSYFREEDIRFLPGGGFVQWENRVVTAISPPDIGPVEAIIFYQSVEALLPQGWADDPALELLSDGRLSVRGVAD